MSKLLDIRGLSQFQRKNLCFFLALGVSTVALSAAKMSGSIECLFA